MAASAISDETFAAPEPTTHVTRTRARAPGLPTGDLGRPPRISNALSQRVSILQASGGGAEPGDFRNGLGPVGLLLWLRTGTGLGVSGHRCEVKVFPEAPPRFECLAGVLQPAPSRPEISPCASIRAGSFLAL